ncbi:YpmS family protein [Loigolactobacillus jiayinensis]|uniref:YpmS family protein n=1 Tax=Loigolactobacillus jiayinensis TaxID=2486016 RepID=A0ABW1REN2_9LACO|nr:YpmS family protein [Loigolactobacillus jiayinensis]
METKKRVVKKTAAKKPLNWWKWLFIALVAILLGSGAYLGAKLTTPAPTNTSSETVIKRDPTFAVNLNKSQVNAVISYYLNHYLKDSKIKYDFDLDEQAILKGKFKLLGYPVPFSIYFDPYVKENGDVELKARRMEIGSLSVPIKTVMNYISHSYKFPKWVVLSSSNKTITLKLNEFKMKNGMQIKATRIDLPNNKINLNVYIPQFK